MINCTGFSGEKKLNFSHWFFFFKKTKQCDSGDWSMIPLFTEQFFKITHELLQSCGWAAKISGFYPSKSVLLTLPNIYMCDCE
jgi:hypothetical protein